MSTAAASPSGIGWVRIGLRPTASLLTLAGHAAEARVVSILFKGVAGWRLGGDEVQYVGDERYPIPNSLWKNIDRIAPASLRWPPMASRSQRQLALDAEVLTLEEVASYLRVSQKTAY